MTNNTRYDIVNCLDDGPVVRRSGDLVHWFVANNRVYRKFAECEPQHYPDKDFLGLFRREVAYLKQWVDEAEKLLKIAEEEEQNQCP